MRLSLAMAFVALIVACEMPMNGSTTEGQIQSNDLSPEDARILGMLRGARITATAGPVFPEFAGIERFSCDGAWETEGAGHADTRGTYSVRGGRICVATDGGFSGCRRVEWLSDSSVRLHPEPEGAAHDYRIESTSEVCAER